MRAEITPAILTGTIPAIPSKSQAHRLLICAALADAPSRVLCAGVSADIRATVRCLNGLGARITPTSGGFDVQPIVTSGDMSKLEAGESGSTLRFLLPVTGALGRSAQIRMEGRLPERPLSPLWEQLIAGGMHLTRPEPQVLAIDGQLRSGIYTLPGDVSSQFISGLLFALPLLAGDSRICITGARESQAYLTMTERALAQYGICLYQTPEGYAIPGGQTYHPPEQAVVEGDWSNSAFWLCAGAFSPAGITVTGLDPASPQGDRQILELLERFGAQVTVEKDRVTLQAGALHGISMDAGDVPDLVPTAAMVAAAAAGETRIENAGRLRIKESDRLAAVTALLTGLGGSVRQLPEGLVISGGAALAGGTVSAWGDHRIAMAAAVASIRANAPVTITGAQAVEKSYPGFWEDFRALGGTVRLIADEIQEERP